MFLLPVCSLRAVVCRICFLPEVLLLLINVAFFLFFVSSLVRVLVLVLVLVLSLYPVHLRGRGPAVGGRPSAVRFCIQYIASLFSFFLFFSYVFLSLPHSPAVVPRVRSVFLGSVGWLVGRSVGQRRILVPRACVSLESAPPPPPSLSL